MALKIIGVGFGRTSTLSTYTALNQLGFPCYHMRELLRNKENSSHLDFWYKVANSKAGIQHDWESIFSRYTATVDNPGCCVWRELLETYPDAKVILTVHPRGAEAWYESTMNTIYMTETMWRFKILEYITPFWRKYCGMTRKLFWQRGLNGTLSSRNQAIAYYNQHIEDVKAAVPKEQLLIFSANQGWKPLCEFLGVAEPETEFPNINDRATIKKSLNQFALKSYLKIALVLTIFIGVVCFI